MNNSSNTQSKLPDNYFIFCWLLNKHITKADIQQVCADIVLLSTSW